MVTPIAATTQLTIQQKLDAQIDVGPGGFALNFDAVCQLTYASVGPTASTIDGDVLIEVFRQIVDVVYVLPTE